MFSSLEACLDLKKKDQEYILQTLFSDAKEHCLGGLDWWESTETKHVSTGEQSFTGNKEKPKF